MLVTRVNKKEQKEHQPGKDPKSGINESAVNGEILLKSKKLYHFSQVQTQIF